MLNFLEINYKRIFLAVFIILSLIFVAFYGINKSGLFDDDEAYYSEVSREMVESNNYIIPEFNYLPFYHKPILFYWFQAVSYKILGISEFSSRLPSAIFFIATILMTYFFVRKLFDKPTALLSSLILFTNVEAMIIAKAATMDMSLLFFITAALYSFTIAFFNDDKKYYYFCYISCALAVLMKGPVGLIIPASIIFLFLLFTRNISKLREIMLLKGIGIFLLITLPWYAGVSVLTNGDFAKEFFFFHNFSRFSRSFEGHSGNIFYYIFVLFIGFYPWVSFLPSAILKSIRRDKKLFFLFLWIIVPFTIFSTSSTKLPNYIFPVFPALSIFVGIWWNEFLNTTSSFKVDKHLSLIIFILLSVGLGILFGLHQEILKIFSEQSGNNYQVSLGIPAIILSILLIISSAGVFFLFKFDLRKHVFTAIILLMLGFNFLLAGFVIPNAWRSIQGGIFDMSRIVKNHAEANDSSTLILYDLYYPSIIFYSGKKAEILSSSERERLNHLLMNCQITGRKVFLITKRCFAGDLSCILSPVDKSGDYLLMTNK